MFLGLWHGWSKMILHVGRWASVKSPVLTTTQLMTPHWASVLTTQEAGRVQVLKGGAGDDIFLFTWSLLQREWQDLCFLSPHIKA